MGLGRGMFGAGVINPPTSSATASGKVIPLTFIRREAASPCSPQPKHFQVPRPASMVNDGLASS